MKGFWGEAAGLRYVQVEPEDGPPDLPLIFAIHGRGASATDLASLAPEVSTDGYRWIFPQGPRPLQLMPGVTGWAWYELGDQQDETVVLSRGILGAFIDDMLGRLRVPRARALLTGFSQGAAMALHVGLVSAEPFAGVVAMSGHLPAADSLAPALPERRDRQVLMVHGLHDQTLPVERARAARAILETAGLAPEYVELPMDHQVSPQSLSIVREFIQRVLPPGGPDRGS